MLPLILNMVWAPVILIYLLVLLRSSTTERTMSIIGKAAMNTVLRIQLIYHWLVLRFLRRMSQLLRIQHNPGRIMISLRGLCLRKAILHWTRIIMLSTRI